MEFSLPNKLTVLRIVLSPVFFALFISDTSATRIASLIVFLIAAITDWYDGIIARKHGSTTELGKFLDPLADKILTSAAFIAFAITGYVSWWMVAIIVLRDFLITALRSYAEFNGWQFITTKFAQTKTFIQMTALYYLLVLLVLHETVPQSDSLQSLLGIALDPTLIYVLMFVVTILTLVTGVQYIYECRIFIARLFTKEAQGS